MCLHAGGRGGAERGAAGARRAHPHRRPRAARAARRRRRGSPSGGGRGRRASGRPARRRRSGTARRAAPRPGRRAPSPGRRAPAVVPANPAGEPRRASARRPSRLARSARRPPRRRYPRSAAPTHGRRGRGCETCAMRIAVAADERRVSPRRSSQSCAAAATRRSPTARWPTVSGHDWAWASEAAARDVAERARRAGASSAAGPEPARRSRRTRSRASAPRCAPTPRPPRARGAGTTPTCSRCQPAHDARGAAREILDAWFATGPSADDDDAANVAPRRHRSRGRARGASLIDARAAARPELGGVERWARELAARLPRAAPGRYARRRARRPALAHGAGHAWEQAVLPLRAARRAPLVLCPANLAPLAGRATSVVLHDAAPLREPGWYSRAYVRLAAGDRCRASPGARGSCITRVRVLRRRARRAARASRGAACRRARAASTGASRPRPTPRRRAALGLERPTC